MTAPSSTTIPRRVTLSMVAREAGVSRTAAYSVLHPGKPTNIGVSAATRKQIEAAAERLGYIANHVARSLASGQSQTIGLLLGDPENANIQLLANCHQVVCAEHGYALQVAFHYHDSDVERQRLMSLFSRGVDCLFVSRCTFDRNTDLLERFVESGIPVVVLGREYIGPRFRYVTFDEEGGMDQLLAHLDERGWRDICYLGLDSNPSLSWSSALRLQHLRDMLPRHPGLHLTGARNVRNYADCRAALLEWFPDRGPRRVVVAFHDSLAAVVMTALYELDIPIPDRAGVAGVDGLDNPFLPVSLTSVQLMRQQHAEACWDVFTALRDRREMDPGVWRIHDGCVMVDGRLRVGASTGGASARSPAGGS